MTRRERPQGLALIEAVCSGDPEVARAVLDGGADPSLVLRFSGWVKTTPLMLAARHGHKIAVEVLLEAGAKSDVRMGSIFGHRGGQNATQQAKAEGHADIAELLRAAAKQQSAVATTRLRLVEQPTRFHP